MSEIVSVDPAWLAAAAAVLVAAALQTATGAGLGLIAGPALLLAMGSSAAVHVAVVLNLLLSVALLPSERRELPATPFAWLTGGALLGLPLGAWVLHTLALDQLQLVAGIAVLLGGVQLLYDARRGGAPLADAALGVAGLLAGVMTAALAIPGPAALWGLARTTLTPEAVRAVLRAFFVVAYTVTLAIHATLGLDWSRVVEATLWMLPSLAGGAAAGIVVKRRASARSLRIAFVALLFAMGTALVLHGLKGP